MGHVNVPVHLRGTLMLCVMYGYVNVLVNWGGVGWGMLTFMCTCVGR